MTTTDIYLMGHNHARGVLPVGDRLTLQTCPKGVSLRCRKQWLGRTGSFLRGYVPGESNYVTDKAMPPSSLGWICFHIRPVRKIERNMDRLTVEISATA